MNSKESLDILVVEDNEVHFYLLEQYLNFSTLKIGKIFRAITLEESLEILKT